MTSPFALLGLGSGADERAIKRAYAQRLRETRPDEDAEGFQRLHAAYQAALIQCREHAQHVGAAEASNDPIATSSEAHAAATAASGSRGEDALHAEEPPYAFDPGAFCGEAFAIAGAGEVPPLQAWLAASHALWSLQVKQYTGWLLVRQLYRQQPAMPAACLETLLHFFDLDHVLAGHDPLALETLKRRLQLAWELQPAHRAQLAQRLFPGVPRNQLLLARRLAVLQRPFDRRRALLAGLAPGYPRKLASFAKQLAGTHMDELPDTIDRAQLRFWLEAADPRRITPARLQLGAVRGLAALLGAGLAGLLLWLLPGMSTSRLPLLPAAVAFGLLALWALWLAWLPLEAWHGRPERVAVRWPWLCMALVPLLCLLAFALKYVLDMGGVATLLLVPTLWLALRRYRRRHAGRGLRINSGAVRVFFVLLIPLGQALAPDGGSLTLFTTMLAAVAMLVWGIDLWAHRDQLRVRGNGAGRALR